MTTGAYQKQVKDVMIRDVVCIGPQDTVDEALDKIVEHGVPALPVVDSKHRCVGVLSVSNLVELARGLESGSNGLGHYAWIPHSLLIEELSQPGLGDRAVGEIMTKPVISVGRETPLWKAAAEMVRHRVHQVFVVGMYERLVGVVSAMEILDAFAAGAPAAETSEDGHGADDKTDHS